MKNKVYKVTFGETLKNQDYHNVSSKNVIATDALDAINTATILLTNSEKKTYYPYEVELLAVLDWMGK